MGQAREVMDRLTEAAMTSRDPAAIGRCYAADAVAHTPDAGELKGREEIVAWWRQMLDAIPDGAYESLYKHEIGNTAIDEGYLSGTNTGALVMPTGESIPATNKRVHLRGSDFATVTKGEIVDYRIYYDQMELLGQLGLIPS